MLSRIDILGAYSPREACTSIGFVRPGGELLLRLAGWPKVQRVLDEIAAIERRFDPATICPDHWRHIHNRLRPAKSRAFTRKNAMQCGSSGGSSRHDAPNAFLWGLAALRHPGARRVRPPIRLRWFKREPQ